MRLLVISDAAQTGFGRVGRELTWRFLQAGWDCRVIGINFRGRAGETAAMTEKGARPDQVAEFLRAFDADPVNRIMAPAMAGGDLMGHNLTSLAVRGEVFPGWTPERILVVADPRAMLIRLSHNADVFRSIRSFNYTPIEGSGFGGSWAAIWQDVTPVAMSEFGARQISLLTGQPVSMIPHGISDSFFPVSTDRPGVWNGQPITSRDEAKASVMGRGILSDRLVLLRTDRFVGRKNYPALFRTVQPTLAEHPEAVLVIHCQPVDDGGSLSELISRMPGSFEVGGLWRHPQVVLTGGHDTFQGLSDAQLNVLYNAADIYVSPTMAEGFGLCLAEAAACAVPVVTTDYAAGPEAVGPGGVLVPVDRLFTNTDSYEWSLVNEPLFTDAVRSLADDPAKRTAVGAAGVKYVRQLSWDAAASQFLELMA